MKTDLIAAIGAAVALSSCGTWQPGTSSVAPDKKTVAQIEVSLAGAPAANRTRVVIKNGAGGTLPQPVYVVEAANAIVDRIRLQGLDANHLQVSLCEATTYRVRTENLRDPGYLDAGRGDAPNAVWVEVENLAYDEITKQCLPRGTST